MLFSHEDPPSGAASSATGSPASIETGTPQGFVVDRPPPGLAQGKYPASPWTIALIGAALLLVTLGYFFRRWRSTRS